MPSARFSSSQQLQDHDLHRDVERGGRLVEDQQPRLDRDRAGDADPRLLAAGELMREAAEQFARQAGQSRAASSTRARERGAATAAQPAQRIGDGVEPR